jgi:hypothetical protein
VVTVNRNTEAETTDARHWQRLTLWIAATSLIPVAVTLYATTQGGYEDGTLVKAAAAIAALLALTGASGAFTCAITSFLQGTGEKPSSAANSKAWFKRAYCSFMLSAGAMSSLIFIAFAKLVLPT